MYVTYFDEVKANPANGQDHYIVGGIAVPMCEIGKLEQSVSALATEVFGSADLTTSTEFHAMNIYFGKGPFKGMEPLKRIEVLSKLADLIVWDSPVKRIYAAIDTSKLYSPQKAPEFAFAHFCERAQGAIGGENISILIGDADDEESRRMIEAFAEYRQSGTPWAYGIEITRLVDSVHFAHSHHSRMIQLADIYVFTVATALGTRKGWFADKFRDCLQGKNLFPNSYKYWAPER